jgi:3-deoxy-manno-octulosonate cytidylyltransferase (CMP-KDO synthetase)
LTTISNNDVCLMIPARMGSKRFPGKVLWEFKGLPMIEHVYRRATLVIDPKNIFITSADSIILNHMNKIGANTVRSTKEHPDGTSRCAEALSNLNYQFVIVLQADEILIDTDHIISILNAIKNNPSGKFWNLVSRLETESDLNNINVVKSIVEDNGEITSIFREPPSNKLNSENMYKIMGVIAYDKRSIIQLTEDSESFAFLQGSSIEQLQILNSSSTLHSVKVDYSYPSINTKSDIGLVESFINNSLRQQMIFKYYVK